jgi:hypothetical protein
VVINSLSSPQIIRQHIFTFGVKGSWRKYGSIRFERDGGFNANERSKILELVHEYQEFLLAEWNKLYPPEETQDHE